VEGKTLTTTAVVVPDLREKLSPTELAEQLKFVLQLRDDLNHLTHMVEQLRSVRQQLQTRNELLKGNPKTESLIKPAQDLAGKMNAVEEKLHNPRAEVAYDILAQRGGAKLYSKLGALYEWAKDSDGLPTQGMRETYAEEARELQQLGKEFQGLLSSDLAR